MYKAYKAVHTTDGTSIGVYIYIYIYVCVCIYICSTHKCSVHDICEYVYLDIRCTVADWELPGDPPVAHTASASPRCVRIWRRASSFAPSKRSQRGPRPRLLSVGSRRQRKGLTGQGSPLTVGRRREKRKKEKEREIERERGGGKERGRKRIERLRALVLNRCLARYIASGTALETQSNIPAGMDSNVYWILTCFEQNISSICVSGVCVCVCVRVFTIPQGQYTTKSNGFECLQVLILYTGDVG